MANEPDESSASTVNGSSSTAMYAIFNNVLQCHQRSKPEVDGRYFVTLLLEPRLFEDFRPLLDHLFHHYDYNTSGGIITTRMAPNTNIHDDYATELGLLFRKQIDDFLNMEPYYARISAYQSRQSNVSEHGRRWEHLGGMRVRLKDPLAKKPGLMFQHSDGKPVIGDKLLELRLADILMEKDTDECPLRPICFRPICFYLHQLSFFLDMAKA
ncbi:hypothetical protein FCIRC_5482 [Fusarium circinatum]|uniref:Uncharacterized protein n=1 Tax=Fusarium circinatum TaxID=48490 RepID=A0A8H5WZJ8_FUSCI|nr:hypothetical protein FCIRC_5482 [Fusarium circinatum]